MKCEVLFLNRINYLLRQKLFQLNPAVSNLNQSAFNMLLFLYQSPDYKLTLKKLEYELQQSQSGINEISLQLERLGYIERYKDPEDKRRLMAKLTPEGISFSREREEKFKIEENYLLTGISEGEKEIYIKVAKKIYENGQFLLDKPDEYKRFCMRRAPDARD